MKSILLCAVVLACAPRTSVAAIAESRPGLRWGVELGTQSDISRTTNEFFDGKTRALPLSGALELTACWPAGRRFRIVTGAGYEHRVHTEAFSVTFFVNSDPPATFDFKRQTRYRSSVVPLGIEMSMSRSWMVGAGCEWRHLFEEADRAVDTKVDGTSFGGRELESWSTNTSSYRREQFAATFTLSRRWSLARSERSLSLRWVEGLQDLLPRGEADIHHRAIQLVAGWSR